MYTRIQVHAYTHTKHTQDLILIFYLTCFMRRTSEPSFVVSRGGMPPASYLSKSARAQERTLQLSSSVSAMSQIISHLLTFNCCPERPNSLAIQAVEDDIDVVLAPRTYVSSAKLLYTTWEGSQALS